MTSQKPPIGIKSRYLHDLMRFREITDAMNRYSDASLPVPKEWIGEVLDIYNAALVELHPIECAAEWIEPTNGADSPLEWRDCSRCGNQTDILYRHPLPKYCEECGAKMKNGGQRP